MVREIGRLQFLVDSGSRWMVYEEKEGDRMVEKVLLGPDGKPYPMQHLVDFEAQLDDEGKPIPGGEPYACSCESFNLRLDRPCRHCIEVFEYLLPIVEHLAHWKPKAKPPEPKPERKKRIYHLPPR